MEPELLLGQGEAALGVLTGELELTTVHGDDGDRQVVLRHLEAVLTGDVQGVSSILGGELPASGPELDPGEAPRGAGATGLVPLEPFGLVAREELTRLVSLRGDRERVHERLGRLLHHTLATQRARQQLRQRGQIASRPPLACEPVEDRLYGAGVREKPGIVQPLGELERRSGVVESVPETGCPSESAVD